VSVPFHITHRHGVKWPAAAAESSRLIANDVRRNAAKRTTDVANISGT
jgi:hypothetical protein